MLAGFAALFFTIVNVLTDGSHSFKKIFKSSKSMSSAERHHLIKVFLSIE